MRPSAISRTRSSGRSRPSEMTLTHSAYASSPCGGEGARHAAPVGALAHPLLRQVASFGDDADELGVRLVYERLEDLTLLRLHLPEGVADVLELPALDDLLAYAVLVCGLGEVGELEDNAQRTREG